MKSILTHILGYFLLIAPIVGYVWVCYFGFTKLILPVIQLYGFWTWLGYIMLTAVVAFICGFVGTWAWATAFLTTSKETDHA